jgi:Bacterial protein of unknown function (DUF885)
MCVWLFSAVCGMLISFVQFPTLFFYRSETLGKELGLYQRPEFLFGQLSMEAIRACRLVVDTGMHAKGWTLQQAL